MGTLDSEQLLSDLPPTVGRIVQTLLTADSRLSQRELADRADVSTCIGREFARLEATLVLATIGQQWTLEWAGQDPTITIEPEITTQTKNGLPMQIRQR